MQLDAIKYVAVVAPTYKPLTWLRIIWRTRAGVIDGHV